MGKLAKLAKKTPLILREVIEAVCVTSWGEWFDRVQPGMVLDYEYNQGYEWSELTSEETDGFIDMNAVFNVRVYQKIEIIVDFDYRTARLKKRMADIKHVEDLMRMKRYRVIKRLMRLCFKLDVRTKMRNAYLHFCQAALALYPLVGLDLFVNVRMQLGIYSAMLAMMYLIAKNAG